MDGIILVNKPKGITSRDVVNEIVKKFHTKRVGHTGTLDPIATGLMIICINKGCKLVPLLTNHDKTYIATVKLGIKTDTYDVTGKVIEENNNYNLSKEDLIRTLNSFIGSYMQEVPIYSSIKVNGKKLYEYARSNLPVELPKHLVNIYSIELLDYNGDTFSFKVSVSKGTYIRSLINDIGNKLSIPMAMQDLNRITVGDFNIDKSKSLEDINESDIIPIKDIFNMKKVIVDDEVLLKKITNGNKLDDIYNEDYIMFINNNKCIAIYKKEDNYLKVDNVF